MIMKKTLITITVLALSAWMTACGSGNTKFPEPPKTTAVSADADVLEETDSADETTEEETTEASSGSGSFSTGQWDGNTFITDWLDMKITFPDDVTIATEEEIKSLMGDTSDGTLKESEAKYIEFTTAYDFLVTLSDNATNFQLMHENVSLATMGKGISAEEYLDIAKEQFESIEDYNAEFSEVETVTLGGSEFLKLSVTIMGGVMMQDYYCVSNEKYVSSMIVSYLPETAEAVNSIMEGITTAK